MEQMDAYILELNLELQKQAWCAERALSKHNKRLIAELKALEQTKGIE